MQNFENSSFVSNSLYTESWFRSFTSYVRRNGDYLNVSIDTEEDFIKNLKSVSLLRSVWKRQGLNNVYNFLWSFIVMALQTKSVFAGHQVQQGRIENRRVQIYDTSRQYNRRKPWKRNGSRTKTDRIGKSFERNSLPPILRVLRSGNTNKALG